MAPIKPGSVAAFLILLGSGLCLPARGADSSTSQTRVTLHPSPPSTHLKTRKPTWHNGPASMPPDTEVLGPHPPSAPPSVRAQILNEQRVREGGKEGKIPAGPALAATRTPAATPKPKVTANNEQNGDAACGSPDKTAFTEMNCLRTHPDARQAFYDELRRTVEEVRAGEKDQGKKEPVFFHRP